MDHNFKTLSVGNLWDYKVHTPMHLHGRACIRLEFSSEKFWVDVIVTDTRITDMIFGRDFLSAQLFMIEMCNDGDILHMRACRQSVYIARDQILA